MPDTQPVPENSNVFDASLIKAGEPEDYSLIVNQLLADSLAGRSQLWPRASLIQLNDPCYFKPETSLYREVLKQDRRNGKEFEYLHSRGTWIEQALCVIALFKRSRSCEEQGRLFNIIEESLLGSKEILAMRTSHFHTSVTKGKSYARQLAELAETKVQAKHSQVHSDVYAGIFSELSAKYVVESAKQLAKSDIAASRKSAQSSGSDSKIVINNNKK